MAKKREAALVRQREHDAAMAKKREAALARQREHDAAVDEGFTGVEQKREVMELTARLRRLHERGAAESVTLEVAHARVTVPRDANMVEGLACVGVELGVAPSQELSFGGVPLQMREMTTVMDLGMEDGAVLRLGGDHSQELLHQVVAGVKAALRTRTAALEREAKW